MNTWNYGPVRFVGGKVYSFSSLHGCMLLIE